MTGKHNETKYLIKNMDMLYYCHPLTHVFILYQPQFTVTCQSDEGYEKMSNMLLGDVLATTYVRPKPSSMSSKATEKTNEKKSIHWQLDCHKFVLPLKALKVINSTRIDNIELLLYEMFRIRLAFVIFMTKDIKLLKVKLTISRNLLIYQKTLLKLHHALSASSDADFEK
ncbi:CLUMA_CG010511, isoform A [Clunio marinus]|uniref:CLUMA_CG010511, isoform A n=1 Tax=Clunio marinus TaxID=568069 RepID=A0A1J1IA23_9DIPT|nr:CLUMA_CG010511, isoform A [Clunio marinus]